MNNNPTNYANRRRSPSPSVRKSPAVGHQTTNLAMGATHQQHRPNNVSSARSSYHAGCQHSNQSRIPVYQRNQSFDTVQSLWVFQNLLIVLDFFFPILQFFWFLGVYSFILDFIAFGITLLSTAAGASHSGRPDSASIFLPQSSRGGDGNSSRF